MVRTTMKRGTASFVREGPADWAVQKLRFVFRVRDDECLKRLALFLVAHAWLDIRLIATSMMDRQRKHASSRALSLDDRARISRRASRGGFLDHLEDAERRGLIPKEAGRIARRVNRVRNNFAHWNRDRGFKARYWGLDVLQPAGFKRFMKDVYKFDDLVP